MEPWVSGFSLATFQPFLTICATGRRLLLSLCLSNQHYLFNMAVPTGPRALHCSDCPITPVDETQDGIAGDGQQNKCAGACGTGIGQGQSLEGTASFPRQLRSCHGHSRVSLTAVLPVHWEAWTVITPPPIECPVSYLRDCDWPLRPCISGVAGALVRPWRWPGMLRKGTMW